MGLGVFVAIAGANRIACHQAANDGFRGLYLHCFQGPDKGKGIVFCSNGDNASVPFNCALTKEIMRMEGWTGIARRQSQFLFKSMNSV